MFVQSHPVTMMQVGKAEDGGQCCLRAPAKVKTLHRELIRTGGGREKFHPGIAGAGTMDHPGGFELRKTFLMQPLHNAGPELLAAAFPRLVNKPIAIRKR
jgi:hypothetical protein